MTKGHKHDKMVENIVLHPELVGLEDVVLASTEMRMLRGNRLVGEMDAFFWTKRNGIYVLEYKCNHSAQQSNKAIYQLTNARMQIYEHVGELAHMIYAHGDRPEWELIQ